MVCRDVKLLIVESSIKAKQIEKYLGDGWTVAATNGHIRDLPLKEMGVEAPDFRPTYVVIERNKPQVTKLKALVKRASIVYLASDLDREGEAIAWHVAQVTKPANFRRVRYAEVTRQAIERAIAEATDIDINLVKAQEARRVLDRLVGYSVSPLLQELVGSASPLSSGRVQSVAVRLVVERERAIRDFLPTEHFRIFADFVAEGGISWRAQWNHKPLLDGQSHSETPVPDATGTDDTEAVEDAGPLWTNQAFAIQLYNALKQTPIFTVASVESSPSHRKPPAPFTTSTLQQAASVALRMSPGDTMKTAQSLFEQGLITYMRTDSTVLSAEAEAMVRNWIQVLEAQRGASLLPTTPHKWAAKKSAQEAHEAIRPTNVSMTDLDGASEQEKQLYRLIWLRTVASQMKSAEFQVTVVQLLSDVAVRGVRQPFVARGRVMLDPGWMSLTQTDFTQDPEESDNSSHADTELPPLNERQRLQATGVSLDAASTKAPPRFTEASLVKALEREGIGRPSTFAAILANIQNREYVEIRSRKVHALALGEVIVDALVPHFQFMDYQFTRTIEAGLDQIAEGKAGFKAVVTYQYDELQASMARARASSAEAPKPLLPAGLAADAYPCTVCDTGFLRRRKGKSGHFWSCSNYPTCTASAPDKKKKRGSSEIEPDLNAVRIKSDTPTERVESECKCPKCGKHKLVQRSSQNGPFWGCGGYPKCKATFQDLDGVPDIGGGDTQS